ncbi:hypothetical protein CFOL_v3_24876, partial [Cephalotus follicularis]
MMAPNLWLPSIKTLKRPLRLADSITCVIVSISHPPNCTFLIVKVHDTQLVSSQDQQAILEQVARMLRISERDERSLRDFHGVHAAAKERGFGRIFRSPSLFEDTIKSILLCNCRWQRTLDMCRALCELQSNLNESSRIKSVCIESAEDNTRKGLKIKQAIIVPGKTKKCANASSHFQLSNSRVQSMGNFPSPRELASLDKDFLNARCNLGYRARNIVKLAKDVESGRLKLNKFEEAIDAASYENVLSRLKKIKGLGTFACANVLMCIGFYQMVPIDTETFRHFLEVHGKEAAGSYRAIEKDVQKTYDKYGPFQSLAYWLELLDYYENRLGKLSDLPASGYHTVSGNLLK